MFSCEFCEIFKNTFLQITSGGLLLHIKNLKLFSDTRWIERYTSLSDFKSLFTDLLHCFEVIRENKEEDRKWDRKSITEANGFLHNISNPSFLVALNCAKFIFVLPKPLQRCHRVIQ